MASSSYLPDCWNDDVRMNALFADIRNKNVNPNDWKSKTTFWSGLINDWCYSRKSSSFSIPDLREAFRRGGRTPKCLAAVVQHMKTQDEVMKMSDFLSTVTEPGWIGWTVNTFFKKPLSYTWSMFVSPGQLTDDDELINFECLKNNANEMRTAHSYALKTGKADAVTNIKVLHALYRDLFATEKDLELAVMWLNSQKKLAFLEQSGQKIVKFSTDPNLMEKPRLTQQDVAVVQLHQSKETLKNQIETLENELEKLNETAKQYIRVGNRASAKATLSKKKTIKNSISNKTNALDNIEVMLDRLVESQTNKLIVDAFKVGTTAFKKTGLTLDELDETMDDIHEVIEAQQDIQQALASPFRPYADDTAELEAELNNLLKQEDSDEADYGEPRVPATRLPAKPKIPAFASTQLPSVPSEAFSDSDNEAVQVHA